MFTEDHIKAMAKTGSLGDYLGLPTTLVGDFGAGTDMGSPIFTILSVKGNQFGGSPEFTYLPGLPLTNLSNLYAFLSVALTEFLGRGRTRRVTARSSIAVKGSHEDLRLAHLCNKVFDAEVLAL